MCISGHYTGDIDLDAMVDETAVRGFDIFMAKLTPAGAVSWSKVSAHPRR